MAASSKERISLCDCAKAKIKVKFLASATSTYVLAESKSMKFTAGMAYLPLRAFSNIVLELPNISKAFFLYFCKTTLHLIYK